MCEEGACGPGTQEMTRKEQDEMVKPWYQNKGKGLGVLLSSRCLDQPMGVGSSH